jgi:putative phosphoesterase
MRLAVLTDIHGNLPALETVLDELRDEPIDGFVIAGDMLAGPNPVEVLNILQTLNCWMIRGNQENYILRYFAGNAPDWWYTSKQWGFMRWNYQQLDKELLEFVAALPEQQTISLPGTEAIRVVHGSPRNISELIFPDKDISLLDIALSQIPERVAVFGHTHRSWQMVRNGKLAFNPGALSGNFTGKPGGGYAILSWENTGWKVELRELHYDIDLVGKAFRESGLYACGGAIAHYWLLSLETGINYLPHFIDFAFEMANQAGYPDTPFVPDPIWEQASELFAKRLNNFHD